MEDNQKKPKSAKAKAQSKEKEILDVQIVEAKDITVEDVISTEIKKFNLADAKIAELKEQFKDLEISGVEDKNGYKAVSEAIKIVRTYRTGVEKVRKQIKEDYLKTGRAIDEEAKRLTASLEEIENPLKDKKQEIDDEIQAEKDRQEAEAQAKTDKRVEELEAVGIKFDGRFYSIGEDISVDIVTIKDFTDEQFAEFKNRVSAVNDKIQEAERIKNLHNERREMLLDFWAYVPEDFKNLNFGEMFEENFKTLLEQAKQGKADFDEAQKKQAEEAQRQADERKALNYEKRSFKFEKEGFEVAENGNLLFSTESGQILIQKQDLEEISNEAFDTLFETKKREKETLLNKSKDLQKQREADAQRKAEEEAEKKKSEELEAKTNSRIETLLKLGLKFDGVQTYIFHDINFDIFADIKTMSDADWSEAIIGATKRKAEIEKEIADKEEAERVQKLPEINKAERYIDEVMKVAFPQLQNGEIAEVLADFKNKIKLASDEAMSNLKNLR
jgi:hypothetical protein